MTDNTDFEDSFTSPHGFVDPRQSIMQTVMHMVEDNVLHFKNDESEHGQRLHSGFRALKDNLEKVSAQADLVKREVSLYDFSADVPGNGFRSFTNIVHKAVLCVFDLCKQVCTNRDSIILFRKGHYVREVEAWGQTLASIATLLDYVTDVLMPKCKDGNLLPDKSDSPVELLTVLNTVSQYSFYGRCLGFHYYESLQKTLKFLNISMSAFSEVYYSDGGFIQRTKQSVITGGKYVMDPEQRARRIVDVVQYSSVDFIKAFWSLAETELLTQVPGIVGPSLAFQQAIVVPCEDQQVPKVDGTATVVIQAPHSHLPPSPITCHLLSAHLREGMLGEKDRKGVTVLPPSPYLILHCHGGGFVTQSTKAQEVFLREWAVGVGVPLLSVDYSLAPEAQYPRALEELLIVYSWVLNNSQLLGSSATKIIFTGDSAGGNLVTGLTLKCLELGIRPPDGLFLAYTPFVFQIVPSPARLLAIMDPMLPLGFALRCLKAYAGQPSRNASLATSPVDGITMMLGQQPKMLPSTAEHPEDIPATLEVPASSNTMNQVPSDAQSDTESFVEVTETDVQEAKAGLSKEVTNMSKSPSIISEPGSDTLTTVSLTSKASEIEDFKKSNGKNQSKKENKEERSKRYVTEFLEKYVLDSRTDKQGRSVPILRTGSDESESDETVLFEASNSGTGIGARLGRAKDAVFTGISSGLSSFGLRRRETVPSPTSPSSPQEPSQSKRPSLGKISLGTTHLRRESGCSLLDEFSGVELISDHYISPLTASHELLAKFPPTSIMSVEYDFCLDDCVTMAKLLRKLGVPVTLDVLDRLPHGFLNLSLVSKEAHDGCKLAVTRMRQLLQMDEEVATEFSTTSV
ncbi:hormone-sensitive lipase [Oratosquilla oratoria]|uniref:hormone-sensitive lipase n=1 Tax=Oratosquilla oratoria TaxID=337810 RepID=UPI003F76B50A